MNMLIKTEAEWATDNTVLNLGQFGYDTTNLELKIGDGESTWLRLPYRSTRYGSGGGGTWGSITGILSAQTDLNTSLVTNNDPVTLSFDGSTIPFLSINGYLTPILVSSDLVLTPNTTNSKHGYCTYVDLVGDGTHTLDLTAFELVGTTTFDNTSNLYNQTLFAQIGSKYIYSILGTFSSSGPITLSAPGSFTSTTASQTQINLSWSTVLHASSYKLEWSPNGTDTWTQIGGTLSQSTTSYNHTSLTTATQYFYRISSIGDGVSYLTSTFATSNTTTSSANQLSTPTLNTPTVISTTELDLGWSTVANVTSWKLEWSANGTTGWTQIGGTIASGTLSYNHTGLTVGTQYFYRLTAIGNGTTYTNSNPSSVVNNTTTAATPTFVSAATSTDGLTVSVIYSKTMPASPTFGGLTFVGNDSGTHTPNAAVRNGGNTSQVDYTIPSALTNADSTTIVANYTVGNIVANDGGILAGFSGVSVTNNVVAGDIQLVSPAPTMTLMAVSGNDLLSTGNINTAYTSFGYQMAGAGRIECDFVDATTNAAMLFAVSLVSTHNNYTNWKFGLYISGANVFDIWNGTTETGFANAGCSKFALERLSDNSIILQKYVSGTWTTLITKTAITGTLYIKASAGTGIVSNPKGINGVTAI